MGPAMTGNTNYAASWHQRTATPGTENREGDMTRRLQASKRQTMTA